MAVLIDMTNDKAVIADNIQELTREGVEKEREDLAPTLEQHRARLEELNKERDKLLEDIPKEEERLGVLNALYSTFEERFPRTAPAEQAEVAPAEDPSDVAPEGFASDDDGITDTAPSALD